MGKILVVDDEEKVARLYKTLLKQEGYEAVDARDAHWAVNLLITQKDIGLILLDIGLPQVDGVTLDEAARQFDPDIKVIVVSALPVSEQRHLIRHADDYYEKSEGLDVLLFKIRDVLGYDDTRPATLLDAFTRRDIYLSSPLHKTFVDRRQYPRCVPEKSESSPRGSFLL